MQGRSKEKVLAQEFLPEHKGKSTDDGFSTQTDFIHPIPILVLALGMLTEVGD